MAKGLFALSISLLLLFAGFDSSALALPAPLPPLEDYVGASACGACHADHYKSWAETFHKNAVRDTRTNPEAVEAHFDGPIEGFSKEDIRFVVGGHWYQRYMVEINGELYLLPRIWSLASHKWEVTDAWSWKKKPYATQCKGCHATRYDPEARVEVEHEVGCESCHGPGATHARTGGRDPILNPAKLPPDERDMICSSCHVRGKDISGHYPFAVGYVPGRVLTDYYRPLGVFEDESPKETFLRTFREWYTRLGQGLPPGCDVCGIDRPVKAGVAVTTSELCLKCHKFKGEKNHGGHPGEISLECQECHKAVSRVVADAGDIHAPDFYLVHKGGQSSWRTENCAKCHKKYRDKAD